MARVIFLNRFYWPEEPATAQLLTDLAEELAARGRAVTIITSHPGSRNVPRREMHRGVNIVRVGGTRASHAGLAGKAADWGSFLIAATWRLLREARRGDTIVAMTDPPLLSIGAWLVAAVRATRLFHWVQDIYPELAIELAGHRWLAVVRPLRNLAWRRADGCVTLGADMAGVLSAHGVAREKIALVPNWAPTGLALTPASAADSLRAKWDLAGKFVVAYSGNLGRVHDLYSALALAEALRDESHFAFVFIGDGAQRTALEAAVTRRRLPNVQFHSAQPRERLAESLAVGDIHLVTLLPGCERYVFPSKLYGIAAVGRPVLFIGPVASEIARIILDRSLGLAFARNQIAEITEALRQLRASPSRVVELSRAARTFSESEGALKHAAARWVRVLDRVEAAVPSEKHKDGTPATHPPP